MRILRVPLFIFCLATSFIVFSFYLFPGSKPLLAQACPNGTSAIQINSGFLSVSNPSAAGNFAVPTPVYSCITNSQAQIPQFAIPSYDDLKSLYYNQSKVNSSHKTEITGSVTESLTSFPLTGYPGTTINQYFEAESGTFSNGSNGNYIFQTISGTPTYIKEKTAVSGNCGGSPCIGGLVTYSFYIPQDGDYQISAFVYATTTSYNTFLVDFDNDPGIDMTKAWDAPSTGGTWQERLVTRRGTTGTEASPQFSPYTRTLTQGNHTLRIRGYDASGTSPYPPMLDKLKIIPTSTGSTPTPIQATDPYRLFHITGNLTIDSNCLFLNNNNQPTCSGDKAAAPVVVFVGGNLTINGNITYGGAVDALGNNIKTYGTVFIVKGSIFVAPAVTELDAVFITAGPTNSQFCDAASSSPCPTSVVPTNALTINGAVISLNPSSPPQFMRTLSNNSTPAETINYQPKYLVNFKDIFGRSLSIWNEIP